MPRRQKVDIGLNEIKLGHIFFLIQLQAYSRLKNALEHEVDINREFDGRKALHVAIIMAGEKPSQHSNDIIKLLIDKGADVNSYDNGQTPLQYAAQYGNKFAVNYILKNGVTSIDLENDEGHTALSLACSNSYIRVAELLIKNGADVNKKNKVGHSAISKAAFLSDLPVVKLLIRKGASVNTDTPDGWSLLHISTECGFPELARLLIDEGADINKKDREGFTPLDILHNGTALFGGYWEKTLPYFKGNQGPWKPENHVYRPKRIRNAIKTYLLLLKRKKFLCLPKDMLHAIFALVAE